MNSQALEFTLCSEDLTFKTEKNYVESLELEFMGGILYPWQLYFSYGKISNLYWLFKEELEI